MTARADTAGQARGTRGHIRSLIFPPLDRCPGCEAGLRGAGTVDLVVLVCTGCGQGWHVELGRLYAVGPPDAAVP